MSWLRFRTHLNWLPTLNNLLVCRICGWFRRWVLVSSFTTICNNLWTLLINHLLLSLRLSLRSIAWRKALPWNMHSFTFNMWRHSVVYNLRLLSLGLLNCKHWDSVYTFVKLKFSAIITAIWKTSPVNLFAIFCI